MRTLGKVSRRASSSSCRIWPERSSKKDAFFLFIDVESHAAEAAGFKRFDQCLGVDERAAADVDQDRPGFINSSVSRRMMWCVSWRERRVERDHFAFAREQSCASVYSTPMLLRPFDRGKRIVTPARASQTRAGFAR